MSATITDQDLQTVVEALKTEHTEKVDVVAPAAAIRCETDGTITIDGIVDMDLNGVGPRRHTRLAAFNRGISDRLGIPAPYLARCDQLGADTGDWALTAANVNAWLDADPAKEYLVRTFNGTGAVARALLSPSYSALDNLDALHAVLAGLRQGGINPAGLQISGDITDTRFFLRVGCPEVATMAPELLAGYRNPFRGYDGHDSTGDTPPVVHAGFELRNSEVGYGAFSIVPRVTILVCKNGLTRPVDAFRKVHLGARLDEGIVEWSNETRQTNVELVARQTADVVARFLSGQYLERVVALATEEAGRPITGDPVKTVKVVAQQLKLADNETDDLVRLFVQGGQTDRVGGVMQAVTALAQTVPSPDRAADLADLGWQSMTVAAGVTDRQLERVG